MVLAGSETRAPAGQPPPRQLTKHAQRQLCLGSRHEGPQHLQAGTAGGCRAVQSPHACSACAAHRRRFHPHPLAPDQQMLSAQLWCMHSGIGAMPVGVRCIPSCRHV